MGFKELKNKKTDVEEEFINRARGETGENQNKQSKKTVSVLLSLKAIDRLKRFQTTEAKKFETQSYVFEEALNDWLDKKGFEK